MLNNRYELGEIIGTGGMSEVYAATDTLLSRDVAVKMLRPEMARDAAFRERFRKEAQNAGRLNHPNIVSLYDTGETDGVPYLVMERIHGRTLRDIVREDGPLSPTEAAAILQPVANALQASHEAGIIHRDIKPANIMLTNTGQVKVMDFGIARALDDSTSAMTQTAAVMGTAQYLSPEQARGNPADARSDIYALGCVFYEIVTGRTPFKGETPFAVAYQHVQEEPAAPSQYLEDNALSPTARLNLDAVILTAMAKHPADRYQSAHEFAEDLARLERGEVTQAARAHVEEEEPAAHSAPAVVEEDDGPRNWTRVLAVGLGVVLLVLVGMFSWNYWSSTQARHAADEQRNAEQANMVKVPEVANRPRGEVVAQLESMGLLVTVNEEPSPDIPRDQVIRVNPGPGSELQRNSSVILTVSSGREITDVPNLVGMTLAEAEKALADAGLDLDPTINEVESRAPKGQVTEQRPSAGAQLSRGSKVSISVSTGPRQVLVPQLSGMNLSEVLSSLESLGLVANVENVDSTEPQGRVLSVSSEGQQVAAGTDIVVRVSNGQLITTPDLVRKSESAAAAELRSRGWTGNFVVGEPAPTAAAVDSGLIGWASVQPGSQIRKDQNIDIRVWRFDLGALVP